MTETVKGHSLDETDLVVQKFTRSMANREPPPADLEEELDALQGVKKYPARVKCATLAWHTLKAALEDARDPVSTVVSTE